MRLAGTPAPTRRPPGAARLGLVAIWLATLLLALPSPTPLGPAHAAAHGQQPPTTPSLSQTVTPRPTSTTTTIYPNFRATVVAVSAGEPLPRRAPLDSAASRTSTPTASSRVAVGGATE